ncbi:MAG: N utilization substance protein B, partial [Treponemataceae bacterium]|nr:N utilization substance protein B [Treponemataceae bacterium]
MSRRKGRVLAFQGLYSLDIGGNSLDDVLELAWAESDTGEPVDAESGTFSRMLIAGVTEHQADIDVRIAGHLSG